LQTAADLSHLAPAFHNLLARRHVRARSEQVSMRQLLILAIGISFVACSGAPHGDGAQVTIRTVSGYSGKPMAGIQVQLENQGWRSTDASGNATFEAVHEPFVVRIHQIETEYEYVLPRSYRAVGNSSAIRV